MANLKGLNEKFVPTEEDRKTVVRLKGFGVKEEIIRSLITHKSTGDIIGIDIFMNVFKKELMTAKSEGIHSAISVFHEGLNAIRFVDGKEIPDYTVRMAAANKIYQLCSKGLLEPKGNIEKSDTSKDKVDKIIEGLQAGTLNTYEADSMIKALEVRTKVELEDMQEKITKMVNKLAEKGIQII